MIVLYMEAGTPATTVVVGATVVVEPLPEATVVVAFMVVLHCCCPARSYCGNCLQACWNGARLKYHDARADAKTQADRYRRKLQPCRGGVAAHYPDIHIRVALAECADVIRRTACRVDCHCRVGQHRVHRYVNPCVSRRAVAQVYRRSSCCCFEACSLPRCRHQE